jgi:MFS family permease
MGGFINVFSGFLIIFVKEKTTFKKNNDYKMALVFNDSIMKRYLLLNSFYGFGISFAWPLFPFVMVDKLSMTVWQVAVTSLFSSITSSLSQPLIGSLMDKIGRKPIIVFSRIIMFLPPIVYAFATSWIQILIMEAMIGVGISAWMSSELVYVIDIASEELRATYIATNMTGFGLSTFIGSLLGGFITNYLFKVQSSYEGIKTGLLISAGLRLITGLFFLKIYETFPKSKG